MTEFDKLSSEYRTILKHDVRWSGENADYFAKYKANYVRNFLGNDFRGRILDYGCGIGSVARFLREYFPRDHVDIVGFDASKESVKKAQKEARGVVFTNGLSSSDTRFFDVVIIANVLHHIERDYRSGFLKKVLEFLKKDGHIFVFEHNPYNPLTQYVVRTSPIDRGVSLLALCDTVKLLRNVNIEMREKKYIVFFPKCMKAFRLLEPLLASIPVGAQYVYVGKFL